MAKQGSLNWSAMPFFYLSRSETLWFYLALISAIALLSQELSRCCVFASSAHFEGFDSEELDENLEEDIDLNIPFTVSSPPPTITQSDFETDHGPPSPPEKAPEKSPPKHSGFEYWDEDEFEGLPVEESPVESSKSLPENDISSEDSKKPVIGRPRSYVVEVICVSFLICFIFNYFSGKRENENIALAWAAKFATKDAIFEKNFSLLGTGDGNDTPLLLKEGQNVFKFYASGRRFCQGLLATMELQSRHDLISRIYNFVIPVKDTITFEVYMNEDAMDQIVFAIAKKKAAKTMQKDFRDLQMFANLMSVPPNRKWAAEDLTVITESKEVALDLITETVLEQVFGEKAFEKFGKGFISLHFSDQHSVSHSKMLVFKFTMPDANNMADMTRLVALVPYYIDLIGRYKLSSQARSKTEAARAKVAQEVFRELQNVRQEEIQRKKAERKKLLEETEAKLSAEAIRKKEERERARMLKKSMPRVKMTRGH